LWETGRKWRRPYKGRQVVTFQVANARVEMSSKGDATMNIARPLGSVEIEKSAEVDIGANIHELLDGTSAALDQGEAGDAEISVDKLTALLRRISEGSTREIENLIGELQTLRKKLSSGSNRIQRDITEHAALSQQVMQLTNIISDSVKKLPGASSINQ
jgi:hypothetical protein